MQIELTGRQVTVTKKLRGLAEISLQRVGRLLGRSAKAHVVLWAEKRRQMAEVTVMVRHNSIVGMAEAVELETALKEALEKTERQAIRLKERIRDGKKRDGKKKREADKKRSDGSLQDGEVEALEKGVVAKRAKAPRKADAAEGAANGNGQARRNGKVVAVPVTVHSFPVRAVMHETHIHRSSESVALRPMTIEEAVKEAEFRDRDVFLFRDPQGGVKVLHRKKDGRIELIEEP